MRRTEAMRLLREDLAVWNRNYTPKASRYLNNAGICNAVLVGAKLSGANFRNANLSRTSLRNADLSGAQLVDALLHGTLFHEANLQNANFFGARAMEACFVRSDLSGATLNQAELSRAFFASANLSGAILSSANLSYASLVDANLSGADLRYAQLFGADLRRARLAGAAFCWTSFADVVLHGASGLDTVVFSGPCSLGVDTLQHARGSLPVHFLQGCGLLPWQIEMTRLFDPNLDLNEIAEIQNEVFNKRTDQFPWAGGVFISYSSQNSTTAESLHDNLKSLGFPTWFDRHNIVAGDLNKQVTRAIRVNDVILLVLSEASIKSDWVEHELQLGRKKEKEENRDVLCPIALDDSWKEPVFSNPDPLWRQIQKKNVLDFSKWDGSPDADVFKKLVTGLKQWYGRKPLVS